MNTPLVSVVCLTYNHQDFVKDTLDGIVSQKIDFDFEIIIHDDASIDRTPSIIKQYETLYPNIFTSIYQKDNQYSKGIDPLLEFVLPLAKGKYIAICEGDDYWTSPNKLQKQIDFLEKNENVNIVYHNVKVIPGDLGLPYETSDHYFNYFDSLLSKNGATLSCVFRNTYDYSKLKEITKQLNIADWPLECFSTINGLGFYFNDYMGVYRIHDNNLTKQLSIKKFLEDRYNFIRALLNSNLLDKDKINYTKNVYNRVVFLMLLTPQIKNKNKLLKIYFNGILATKHIPIKYNKLLSINRALKKTVKYYFKKWFQ